jgi:hypothetical protein
MYVHGGFEPEFPNKPLDSMISVDLTSIGTSFPKLSKYFGGSVSNILGDKNQNNEKPTT